MQIKITFEKALSVLASIDNYLTVEFNKRYAELAKTMDVKVDGGEAVAAISRKQQTKFEAQLRQFSDDHKHIRDLHAKKYNKIGLRHCNVDENGSALFEDTQSGYRKYKFKPTDLEKFDDELDKLFQEEVEIEVLSVEFPQDFPEGLVKVLSPAIVKA